MRMNNNQVRVLRIKCNNNYKATTKEFLINSVLSFLGVDFNSCKFLYLSIVFFFLIFFFCSNDFFTFKVQRKYNEYITKNDLLKGS